MFIVHPRAGAESIAKIQKKIETVATYLRYFL